MAYHSSPNQLANLKHFTSDQDREAARINGQKAGKASAETRRKKKRLQDAAKWLLQSKSIISDAEIKAKLLELGVTDESTNAEALMLIALRKAAKGDVEAMKFIRDTGGEAPKNQVELSGDLDRPVATMDLRGMTNEQLMALAENRSDDGETGADED